MREPISDVSCVRIYGDKTIPLLVQFPLQDIMDDIEAVESAAPPERLESASDKKIERPYSLMVNLPQVRIFLTDASKIEPYLLLKKRTLFAHSRHFGFPHRLRDQP